MMRKRRGGAREKRTGGRRAKADEAGRRCVRAMTENDGAHDDDYLDDDGAQH